MDKIWLQCRYYIQILHKHEYNGFFYNLKLVLITITIVHLHDMSSWIWPFLPPGHTLWPTQVKTYKDRHHGHVKRYFSFSPMHSQDKTMMSTQTSVQHMFCLPGSFNKYLPVQPCEQGFSGLIQLFCQSVYFTVRVTIWSSNHQAIITR